MNRMTIHEFGAPGDRVVVLVHPSVVMWDYFEYVIPRMQDRWHLVVPALPGYDPDRPGDFTSVESVAAELADWLLAHGHRWIACIYGCSMGGAIVARFLADGRVRTDSAIMDGGITPYRLPRLVTRLIAVRDFLMIGMGKLGGVRLLEKAFSSDDYTDEDYRYLAGVLKMMSAKTIWRTFDSCNNYAMPDPIDVDCPRVEYWYAETEAKARKWDIDYVKKHFPGTRFRVFGDVGHGGLATLKPALLVEGIEAACVKVEAAGKGM